MFFSALWSQSRSRKTKLSHVGDVPLIGASIRTGCLPYGFRTKAVESQQTNVRALELWREDHYAPDRTRKRSTMCCMTSANTPAGWYDDGQGALRWWDGNQWTKHAQPSRPSVDAAAQKSPSFVQNLAAKEDPTADPDAIWAAVGKPLTGIGGGRYKLTEQYLFFEKGTLSTTSQQISTHEIFDVDATQTMTQKARGLGTIVLFAVRSGSGMRERVELVDVEHFREGVAALNRVSHEARERLRVKQQTQTINYTGFAGAPSASTPSAPAAQLDLTAELAKLAALKEQGHLDDDEFTAAKRRLLGL